MFCCCPIFSHRPPIAYLVAIAPLRVTNAHWGGALAPTLGTTALLDDFRQDNHYDSIVNVIAQLLATEIRWVLSASVSVKKVHIGKKQCLNSSREHNCTYYQSNGNLLFISLPASFTHYRHHQESESVPESNLFYCNKMLPYDHGNSWIRPVVIWIESNNGG